MNLSVLAIQEKHSSTNWDKNAHILDRVKMVIQQQQPRHLS